MRFLKSKEYKINGGSNKTRATTRFVFIFFVWMSDLIESIAEDNAKLNLNHLKNTNLKLLNTNLSTKRPWPSHDFFLELISATHKNITNFEEDKKSQKYSNSLSGSLKNESFILSNQSQMQNVFSTSKSAPFFGENVSESSKYKSSINFANEKNPKTFPVDNFQEKALYTQTHTNSDKVNILENKREIIQTESTGFSVYGKPLLSGTNVVSSTLNFEKTPILNTNQDKTNPQKIKEIQNEAPPTIWYKPSNKAAQIFGSNHPVSIKPNNIAKVPDSSDLIFKVWSYVNGELKLFSQKKIPKWVLRGKNFSDNEILNIDQVPESLKKDITSAFNYSSSVIKRHSGPGNDFHWQKLPVIIPDSTTPSPVFSNIFYVTQRPQNLNYIIWTTPRPIRPPLRIPPLLVDYIGNDKGPTEVDKNQNFNFLQPQIPPPPPLLSSGLDSWLQIQCYLNNQKINSQSPTNLQNQTPTNLQTEVSDTNGDKNIQSNLESLAFLIDNLNQNKIQNSQNLQAQSPQIPTRLSNNNNNNKNNKNNKNWASIYPLLYEYFQNQQLNNKPTTFSEGGAGSQESSSQDYSFYPIIEEDIYQQSQTDTQPYKTDISKKKSKKKVKKYSKKHGKKHKKKGNTALFDPDKFHFNYVFGIDFLGTLKKVFFTIVALKTAPLIILTFLALVPFLLLIYPKIIALTKYAVELYFFYKGEKYKTNENDGNYGWNYAQNPGVHHHFHGYPASEVGSLVHASYGDSFNPRSKIGRVENDQNFQQSQNVEKIESSGELVVYDTDLDTEHNRKVMEILLENKNATIQRLLESWEIDKMHATTAAPSLAHRKKKIRKRRNSFRKLK